VQLGIPLLTLIDTPSAEPGSAAEADGIAGEIARTIAAVAAARVVTVSLCVGEGGSGGAMALGYTDRAFLLRGAVFSVIGPEAAGAILARDPARAPEMADALGLTGPDLLGLGIVDGIVPDAGPDVVKLVRDQLVEAMANATAGDRMARSGRATQRWLRV
jgi:acetyl-CoA carboxylase carboxyl transferase subunit beta